MRLMPDPAHLATFAIAGTATAGVILRPFELREAIFAVHIPERPGAFVQLCKAIGNRPVTEFNYRFGNPDQATVFVGIEIIDQKDREQIMFNMQTSGFEG